MLKNARREPLDFASCLLDSIGIAINPYRGELNNKGIIVDSSCRAISFCPKGYCKDFRQCRIELDITKIKSGTLIELVVYSTEMEMSFNNRKFILTRNILHEIETYNAHGKKITQYNLDESANNFIRKK